MKLNYNTSDNCSDIIYRGEYLYRALFNSICSSVYLNTWFFGRSSGDIDYAKINDFIMSEYNVEKSIVYKYDTKERNITPDCSAFKILDIPYDILIIINSDIKIHYNEDQKGAKEFSEKLLYSIRDNCLGKPIMSHQKQISIVESRGDRLETEEFKVVEQNINIEDNYNDDIVTVYPKVVDFLNSDKSGLILMHGPVGTGKTSYIRKLITDIDKKFVYIPKDLFSSISMPSFTGFLSTITDSVIILEDSEDLLCPRNGVRSSVVSELLNFTDGLLSDMFKLKFICTCNSEISGIDSALMRPGRLIADLYFDALSTEKANNLLCNLDIKKTVTSPTPLSDIYCSTKTILKVNKPERKIGF